MEYIDCFVKHYKRDMLPSSNEEKQKFVDVLLSMSNEIGTLLTKLD